MEFKRHIQGLLDNRKAEQESAEKFASKDPQIKQNGSEKARTTADLQAAFESKLKFANGKLEIVELAARNTPSRGVRKVWQEVMKCKQVTEPNTPEPNTREPNSLSGTGFSNAPLGIVYTPATNLQPHPSSWKISEEQAQRSISSFTESIEKRHLHPSFGVGSSNISLNGLQCLSSTPTGSRPENWQKYAKLSQASFSNLSTSREEKHTLFNVASANSSQNNLRISTTNLRGENAWFSETYAEPPQSLLMSPTPSLTKRKRAIEDIGREGGQKKMTIKNHLDLRSCA